MTLLQEISSSGLRRCLVLTLPLMLAACAEHVALTETKPALPLPFLQPAMALATGDFVCEQGNRVEVSVADDNHMELRWRGRSYTMARVPTTTGALRFENSGDGLVWIQIPAKSMLLNSKLDQQLANNCKNG